MSTGLWLWIEVSLYLVTSFKHCKSPDISHEVKSQVNESQKESWLFRELLSKQGLQLILHAMLATVPLSEISCTLSGGIKMVPLTVSMQMPRKIMHNVGFDWMTFYTTGQGKGKLAFTSIFFWMTFWPYLSNESCKHEKVFLVTSCMPHPTKYHNNL